jgi:hypothetical protein
MSEASVSLGAWSPAPNRHLEPLWNAALHRGALARVHHAGDWFHWPQRRDSARWRSLLAVVAKLCLATGSGAEEVAQVPGC